MTTLETTLTKAVSAYIFDKVWNEPHSEYRSNFVPRLYLDRSYKGTIEISGVHVSMPTNDAYYVYTVTRERLFQTFILKDYTWVSATDLCNNMNTTLSVYDVEGRQISYGAMYLLYEPKNGIYILAIQKKALLKVMPSEKRKELYATIYTDSDPEGNVTINSFYIPTLDNNNTVRDNVHYIIRSYPNPTVLINGHLMENVQYDDLPLDGYVDVINDEDIVLRFSVDLSIDANSFIFHSKDNLYKNIIHIPKALNPLNKIYTHNTMDVYVSAKSDPNRRLLVHRVQPNGWNITNVTHNDIAIPTFILDAYRDYLGTQDIVVTVYVREHDKNNVLIRDSSYIDMLYYHSDKDICHILEGTHTRKTPDYWRARHLEKSEYVQMFFDIPDHPVPSDMTQYIEALGYYHVLSLLCHRITTTYVTSLFPGYVAIKKSPIYQGKQVFPVVRLNGRKVFSRYVKYVQNNGAINVYLDSAIPCVTGDVLMVELFVDDAERINDHSHYYTFEPTPDNKSITIPYRTFDIYEVVEHDYLPVMGFDHASTISYKLVGDYVGKVIVTNTDTGTTIDFGMAMHGKKFVIQNNKSIHVIEKDIDQMMQNGDPIVVDLSVPVYMSSNAEVVESLVNTNTLVFLNGRYLINGLDYMVRTITSPDGISFRQVVIQNMSYLKSTGNKVEVICTSTGTEDVHYGFTYQDTISADNPTAIYFNTISTVHVSGTYEDDILERENVMELPPDTYREGAPYEVKTAVPKEVKTFLDKYHANDDKVRLVELNNYFYGTYQVPEGIVVLTDQHNIYSPHMNTVIRDTLDGTLPGIAYDPDKARMLNQIKQYAPLMQLDIVHTEELDLRYVNIYPSYRNYTTTPMLHRALNAIGELLLPKDTHTGGVTPHD